MGKERIKLNKINLKGFKSINRNGQDISFGDVTILLGANGSGKSNLVSFFRMLNYMNTGALQKYIGLSGFADSLLHYGSKNTSRLEAEITFGNNDFFDQYSFSLAHAAGDTLIFTEETLSWKNKDNSTISGKFSLEPGIKESGLYDYQKNERVKAAQIIYYLIKNCQVFQFHDTSQTAKIRNSGYINDNEFIRSDGGNLAAFLYSLKKRNNGENYYNRIIRYIRSVMPQFRDFNLVPSPGNENYIMLNWKDTESDYLFGPHQLSDGAIRFIALTTLLLQPPDTLPSVIVLDEPELGLHPQAIAALAGMIKAAGINCQVVLATQSTRLVDEFDVGDIVVVEWDAKEKCSKFNSLDEKKLADWLERYSTGELWEKNIIGGRP